MPFIVTGGADFSRYVLLRTNELASRLGLSTAEIDAHLASLFARMGAASRTEAVAFAMRRGLLSSGGRRDQPTNAFTET